MSLTVSAPSSGRDTPELRSQPGLDVVGSLFQRLRQRGDRRARDELTRRFMPLARQKARQYRGGAEPMEDLLQVAAVGLVKAIDRFDPARGVAFSSYAGPTIAGELKRHFRDHGWAAHVPRGVQENVLRIERATRTLTGGSGRAPTVDELARATGLTDEDVLEALQATRAHHAVSLDTPRSVDTDQAPSLVETMGAEDARYELIVDDAFLAAKLRVLPERERAVLRLRFLEGWTQTQIADHIGVSQMQVSRLLRRSLERMQAIAGAV